MHAQATCAADPEGRTRRIRDLAGWRSGSTPTGSTATTTTTPCGSGASTSACAPFHCGLMRLGQPASVSTTTSTTTSAASPSGGESLAQVAVPRRRDAPLPRPPLRVPRGRRGLGGVAARRSARALGEAQPRRDRRARPRTARHRRARRAVRASTATPRVEARSSTAVRGFLVGGERRPERCSTSSRRASIETADDLRDRFVARFYFGCEADDPMNVVGVQHAVVTHSACASRRCSDPTSGTGTCPTSPACSRKRTSSSTTGSSPKHDFRDFAFTNPARLYTQGNPDFFTGTAVRRRGQYASEHRLTHRDKSVQPRAAWPYDLRRGSGWVIAIGHRHGDVTDVVESTELRQNLGDARADDLRRAHDALRARRVVGARRHRDQGVGRRPHDRLPCRGRRGGRGGRDPAVSIDRLARRRGADLAGAHRAERGRRHVRERRLLRHTGRRSRAPVRRRRRWPDPAQRRRTSPRRLARWAQLSLGRRARAEGPAGAGRRGRGRWERRRAASGSPAALTVDEQVPFVGRRAERERLLATWKDAASGRGAIALLSGEPGIGKTRLAAELARVAHDDGAIVLYGRCDEELGVPYQPFVEALRPYVAASRRPTSSPRTSARAAAISPASCPSSRPASRSAGTARTPTPRPSGTRCSRRSPSFLASIAATARRWSSCSTTCTGPTSRRCCCCATCSRAATPCACSSSAPTATPTSAAAHPLADVLADLRRDVPTERISLQGLDGDEVAEFLAAAAGQALDADGEILARRVHAETEGNPFFREPDPQPSRGDRAWWSRRRAAGCGAPRRRRSASPKACAKSSAGGSAA